MMMKLGCPLDPYRNLPNKQTDLNNCAEWTWFLVTVFPQIMFVTSFKCSNCRKFHIVSTWFYFINWIIAMKTLQRAGKYQCLNKLKRPLHKTSTSKTKVQVTYFAKCPVLPCSWQFAVNEISLPMLQLEVRFSVGFFEKLLAYQTQNCLVNFSMMTADNADVLRHLLACCWTKIEEVRRFFLYFYIFRVFKDFFKDWFSLGY